MTLHAFGLKLLTFSTFLEFFVSKKVVQFSICDRLIYNTCIFEQLESWLKLWPDDVICIWAQFTHIQYIFRLFRKQKSCSVFNLRSIDIWYAYVWTTLILTISHWDPLWIMLNMWWCQGAQDGDFEYVFPDTFPELCAKIQLYTNFFPVKP